MQRLLDYHHHSITPTLHFYTHIPTHTHTNKTCITLSTPFYDYLNVKGLPRDGHRPQLAHSSATRTACWTDHPRFLHTSPEPSQLSVRPIERRKERRGQEWGVRAASGEGAETYSKHRKECKVFLHKEKVDM